jgi:hypothetical protein
VEDWIPEQTRKFTVIVFHGTLKNGGSCVHVCPRTLAHMCSQMPLNVKKATLTHNCDFPHP